MKYRIGVDLDGVCYDFVGALRTHICEVTDRPIEELDEAATWYFFRDQWGYSVDEYLEFVFSGVNARTVFWKGELIPGAVEAVNQLYTDGYEIVIITARSFPECNDLAKEATEHWLDSVGILHHELIIANDKTGHNLDVLIDDSPGNIQNFMDKGLRAVAFDQPWNASYAHFERVKGWDDAVQFVRKNFPILVAKPLENDRILSNRKRANAHQ